MKSTLRGSGIYSSAVDQALDSAAKNAAKDNSVPFDQPEVRAAVKKAIPPEQLQTWAEQMIDGTYGWLNSGATDPVINLDFATAKQNLADNLGNYAVARAKALPVCTNAQLLALQSSGGDVDPFTAICIPKGFDLESLRTKVEDEVLKNTDVFDKSSFSAADFPKNEQGKTVFEQASLGRTGYQWAKNAPYILVAVACISAGLWVLMHDKKRRGIYVVGRSLLGVGVFILVGAIVLRYLITQVSSPAGPLVKHVQGDTQSTVIYVVRNLSNSVNNVYLVVGLVYAIAGGAALLVLHFTKPKAAAPVSDESEVEDKNETPSSEDKATPADSTVASDKNDDVATDTGVAEEEK